MPPEIPSEIPSKIIILYSWNLNVNLFKGINIK
jgi:hypothetical protein